MFWKRQSVPVPSQQLPEEAPSEVAKEDYLEKEKITVTDSLEKTSAEKPRGRLERDGLYYPIEGAFTGNRDNAGERDN